MKRSTFVPFAALTSAAALLLSACGPAIPSADKPRVELPQNFRLPENDVVKMFEPRVGRIAIASEDGNILVMDQTGSNIVQITKDANRGAADNGDAVTVNSYSLPVFSPSGQQLALVELTAQSTPVSSTVEVNPDAVIIQRGENSGVVVDGPNGQVVQPAEPGMRVERQPSRVIIERGDGGGQLVSSALYVASADGKRPLREVYNSDSHSISYVDWSPDNARLAFLATRVQDSQTEMKLIEAREGARAKTIFEGADVAWNWHPDSQSLVAKVGAENAANRLNTFDIAGGTAGRVQGANSVAFNTPQFSPDGGFLLLTEKAGGKNKLVLADRNGSKVKDLVEFEGESISFAWSPRGAKIAYIVRSQGQPGSPLTVLDVNSGEKRVITNNPVVTFFWSPDGERIAAFSLANRTDIPENFAGFSIVPEINTTLFFLETLDSANGSSRPLFYFAPTTAFLRLAAEFDRYSRGLTIWSPDSRKLVFTLMFGDQNGTRDYVVETEGSGSLFPRVIGNGALAFWSPK
jgi:Tol biopolymer transport system component